MKWKIFYGDMSTFSSEDGSPYDAPRLNVQVIIGPDPDNGRYVMSQRDVYWWDIERDRWFGGDRRGEWDYLCQLGPRVVLYGRFIGNRDYNTCISAALSDPDFPPKSAIGQGEEFLND